jgi:hypothetical protein
MALKGSDNPFPSVLLVEGDPEALDANPASGQRRLSVDAAGDLFLTDDAGVATQMNGGGGGLVLLEQHSASASSSLDFTTFISSTYDVYKIEGTELVMATNAVDLRMQVGTGGGPTYDTGNNYQWGAIGRSTAPSTLTDDGTTGAGVRIVNDMANAAGYGFCSFSLTARCLQSTALRKTFEGTRTYINITGGTVLVSGTVGGQWTTHGTAVTALRFIASSGNITSGTIRIYGVAK